MPIEIRELVIRTHIDDSAPAKSGLSQDDLVKLKKSIVSECLSQVREQMQQDHSR